MNKAVPYLMAAVVAFAMYLMASAFLEMIDDVYEILNRPEQIEDLKPFEAEEPVYQEA